MARILDTSPDFDAYARTVALDAPWMKEQKWAEDYGRIHADVFEAFFAAGGAPEGKAAMVRELSRIRSRVETAAPVVREAIEALDPALADALGVAPEHPPLHVLLVGTFSVNAAVGRLDGDVAVFHCLEWFQDPEGARILIAHEGTHAWHQIARGDAGPQDDLAWVTFYEGLAVRASRTLVPGRPESDYFWYGHEGFDEWLPWCKEHRGPLRERFAGMLDDPLAAETFFGAGTVDGHWRTGFFVADELVSRIDAPLPELAQMSVDEGRAAVRSALDRD
ncbi:MAG: hypothetical protein ABR575_10740 [Actinomycetota bacterium]